MTTLMRQGHFLGAKIRALRKRNGLTLEELSLRCIQMDAKRAPSVSYLSMIERGRRTPSRELLDLFAEVFQKEPNWFLDENADVGPIPRGRSSGGLHGIPLEPGFLFSRELLQSALPELLSQTGTTGRQFAQLLIRSYQEMHRNELPDLERSAEEVGGRRMPLGVDDLLAKYKAHGLVLRWFEREPSSARTGERKMKSLVRSLYEAPNTVYMNRVMQRQPARLKYELATHLGHKILHQGDGQQSMHATSGLLDPQNDEATGMSAQDVLHAWRDFECSFFAGALLCPKLPFRRFLMREAYQVSAGEKLEVTPALVMRRMTAVSPYRHWHYFDAYHPGYLRAVYRGNGIPLPWGNMSMVTDPCPRWAVFALLTHPHAQKPTSQISLMQDGEAWRLYCCHSLRAKDAAGNTHVLSVGIDMAPGLDAQGFDSAAIIFEAAAACQRERGEAPVPRAAALAIATVARVLNIGWISDALSSTAKVICPRSIACPRPRACDPHPRRAHGGFEQLRQEILEQVIE